MKHSNTSADRRSASWTSSGKKKRRGLVLGGGGLLGGCWTLGVLSALHERTGRDPGDADVIVGTSAGSVLALLLASGVHVDDLVDDQYGLSRGPLAECGYDHDTALDTRFSLLRLPLGSPQLLLRNLCHPLQSSPVEWLAALCPCGRGSLAEVRAMLSHVLRDEWPPDVHLVATNYDRGGRVLFSGSDREPVDVLDAVTASCSVPSWFPPVLVHGERYVDGSVSSATNADVLADHELDEIDVIAPLAATSFDRPLSALGWAERAFRVASNHTLRGEVRSLDPATTTTRVFAPSAQDLAAMGPNVMDPRKRLHVLETAHRTTAAAIESPAPAPS